MELFSMMVIAVLSVVIVLLVCEPLYSLIRDWKLRRDLKLRDRADAMNKNRR